MQHQDGWSVSRSPSIGITKLIVIVVCISDLHAQGSAPVPANKEKTSEKDKTRAQPGYKPGDKSEGSHRFAGLLRQIRLGSHWCHNETTGPSPVHLVSGQV